MLRDNSFKSKGDERELLGVDKIIRKYTAKNQSNSRKYLSMALKVNARKQVLMHYVVRNVT